MMARNHGSTRRMNHSTPTTGLSAGSQRACRSKAISETAVNPTIIRISGPLMSMPPASAVQKIPGKIHLRCRLGALAEINARHRAHGRNHGEKEHRIGFREPRFDTEQNRSRHHDAREHRGAPRRERKRGPVCEQNPAARTNEGWNDDRARFSVLRRERQARYRSSRSPLAANRSRPAFYNGLHPGIGCRHNRPSPPSASSPARNALHRDRSAECA